MPASQSPAKKLRALVYSDDVDTRQAVINGSGVRFAHDLPEVEWTEAATAPAAKEYVTTEEYHLLVLDGETPKISGMIVAKDLQQELAEVPPIVILTGRPQDEWLAVFSGAAAVVSHPLDPLELQETLSRVLRHEITR